MRGTKIDGGQRESEAQPLAVLIASDSYQRLLKIGTVSSYYCRKRKCNIRHSPITENIVAEGQKIQQEHQILQEQLATVTQPTGEV
jgi:hypothetical protein